MAKIYGIAGNVTGKIANQVYAVVKGVNVVRQYNAQPANPQTPLQIASRAKMKLLSQFAAAVAPIILLSRDGLKTPRNIFIQKNYDKASFNSQTEVAELNMAQVDLSGGLVGMPSIAIDQRAENTLQISLTHSTDAFDFVMYGGVIVDNDGRIMPIQPVRVNRQDDLPDYFSHTFQNIYASASGYIYGIGVRLNDQNAKAKYAQLMAAGTNVNILVNVLLTEMNITKSETKSIAFSQYQA